MLEYTSSDARQHFATLLNEALKKGGVRIRRKDGQVFVVKPESRDPDVSPLDVPGLALGISRNEIVDFVREGRRPKRH